jgi:hypothetical protein
MGLRIYQNSVQRTEALLSFNYQYNWHRPHASFQQKYPSPELGFMTTIS